MQDKLRRKKFKRYNSKGRVNTKDDDGLKRNKVIFLGVIVFLLVFMILGTSFGYFLANIKTSNEENKNSDISTSNITKVVMDMQGSVSSDGAYPGHVMVKEVIVKGIGNNDYLPVNTRIKITPRLGDFKDSVVWRLYKSKEEITCKNIIHNENSNYYEEGSCLVPSDASLEVEGSNGIGYKSIEVRPNTETKYYLIIEYLNKDNQNEEMGKSFSIDIGLDTSEEEILREVDNSVAFKMSDEVAGIKVNSLGDGVYEINGTTKEQVNVRLSDYFMTSSPNGDGLISGSSPNDKVIMEKNKTYRISYEYISGSNTIDKYNSFRLVFAEPNSYKGLQTFAYDFYAGFVGTEKMIQNIGMYFLWISKGYTFNNYKFRIKIYEITDSTEDFGNIIDVKTLDKNGTTITGVWYDTGIVSVFGVNDMNVSEGSRETTYINLTTRSMGFSFKEIYDSTLASKPLFLNGDKVRMTYTLVSNAPNIDITGNYMSQVYFELMDTGSSPKTIKPPSISSENADLSSSEVIAEDTLKNDISTPVLIIGKNVNIQKPWRFKIKTEKE